MSLDIICAEVHMETHTICKTYGILVRNCQGGYMQIRRNENLLFPSFKTNLISNNKFLSMAKVVKDDTSAVVTISKEGRAKARMLDETSKKEQYMKDAESKMDGILDTIRSGGTLSKEDEEFINKELKNISEKKYKDYKDLRLNPEDVLQDLKENYLRRQSLFFDMQEQVEADAKNQIADDNAKIMEYMQEKEYDEEIIEMVKDCAEDEEEQDLEEKTETEELAENETGEQEINLNVGEQPLDENVTEDVNLQKRAMNVIENIEDKMQDVEEAGNKSRKKEHEFAKALEEDYKRLQQVVNNEEVSAEDKVKAYTQFVEEARINAHGREVERIRKEFDAETLMMARIMVLGQNGINNVIKGNVNHSQMGTEFIKSFLV